METLPAGCRFESDLTPEKFEIESPARLIDDLAARYDYLRKIFNTKPDAAIKAPEYWQIASNHRLTMILARDMKKIDGQVDCLELSETDIKNLTTAQRQWFQKFFVNRYNPADCLYRYNANHPRRYYLPDELREDIFLSAFDYASEALNRQWQEKLRIDSSSARKADRASNEQGAGPIYPDRLPDRLQLFYDNFSYLQKNKLFNPTKIDLAEMILGVESFLRKVDEIDFPPPTKQELSSLSRTIKSQFDQVHISYSTEKLKARPVEELTIFKKTNLTRTIDREERWKNFRKKS